MGVSVRLALTSPILLGFVAALALRLLGRTSRCEKVD
jgi:hypothetical protein